MTARIDFHLSAEEISRAQAHMASYQRLVEEGLSAAFDAMTAVPPPLREAMRYSTEAGGKRLRPVLLLAACAELYDTSAAEALPYAIGLELIHTYSLIHDDLPAMDNDDTRRGRPASHIAFGEAMAILAGDGLLSEAFAGMLSAAERRVDPHGLRAAAAIARRCGAAGMVAGQALDMADAGEKQSLAAIQEMYTLKTAQLLIAAMEAGALVGGCAPEALAPLTEYGLRLGLAFQMTDDLLDRHGDPAVLGKQVGQDEANGKVTWLSLRGEAQTRLDIAQQLTQADSALRAAYGERAAFFTWVAAEMAGRSK